MYPPHVFDIPEYPTLDEAPAPVADFAWDYLPDSSEW
jgi:hypothetical protein